MSQSLLSLLDNATDLLLLILYALHAAEGLGGMREKRKIFLREQAGREWGD